MPFDDYVERNIFGPLAMTSTSFRQPLPPALLARVSVGYETSSKPGHGYELINMPPAGSSFLIPHRISDSWRPCRTTSKAGGVSGVGMEQAYPRSPSTARRALGCHERQIAVAMGTRPRLTRSNAIGNIGGRNGSCRSAVAVGYSHSHSLAHVGVRLAALGIGRAESYGSV